jgi:hypothetical protein
MLVQGRGDLFVARGFRAPDEQSVPEGRQLPASVFRRVMTLGFVHQAAGKAGRVDWQSIIRLYGVKKNNLKTDIGAPQQQSSISAAAEQ